MSINIFFKQAGFVLLFFVCGITLRAQLLDSLEGLVLQKDLPIDKKIDICDDLSWEYRFNDPDKARKYARQGIALAEKEHNEYLLGNLYRNLGVIYCMDGIYDTSEVYFDRALSHAIKAKDQKLESFLYIAYGVLNKNMSRDDRALEYYEKALRLSEALGIRLQVATISLNMGSLHHKYFNYEAAKERYQKALIIFRETDDKQQTASALTNLSIACYNLNEMKEGLKYSIESAEIARSIGDKSHESAALLSMANIYSHSKDYDKALESADRALVLAEEIGFPNSIVEALKMLSFIYYDKGDFMHSKTIGLQSLSLIDSADVERRAQIIYSLLKASILLNEREAALGYVEEYIHLNGQLSDKETKASLFELEIKYETEKKELQIAAFKKDKILYTWLGIAGGTVLLLVLAFLLVRQRMIRQKLTRIEKEKQLTATQAVLDGETAERTRLARDLHDGLGGMLSIVKLNLYDMKKGITLEGEEVARFQKAMTMLDESIGELRRVAHNMMPDSLARYGLKTALGDFCNSVPGAVFNFYGPETRMDSKLEVMVYRTAYELVNNAMKHSGAQKIMVQIVQDADRVALVVQDDGSGFDTAAVTSGSGLNNIRHRVESYNGTMDIWSEIGKGTEVSVVFNVEAP